MRLSVDIRPLTVAPLSGIGRQNRALVNALAAAPDREVFPVTAAPRGHPVREWAWSAGRPTPVHGLHRPWNRCRFEAIDLPRFLVRKSIDVHIATSNMGLPWGPMAQACRSTRRVLQVHDVFQLTEQNPHRPSPAAWLRRQVDRISIHHAVRTADAIWVPSQWTAQRLCEVLPGARHRVRVLPHAVPAEDWTVEHPRPLTAPARYWLAVGTRAPRKNIDRLVDVWRGLKTQQPSLPDLLLVGRPQDLSTDSDGVRFLQGLTGEELVAWLRHADCLWHPAWAEGFGLPVVEAAACGTPLAVARGSALDEVCPSQARRFDPLDPVAMGALMRELDQVPRHLADALRHDQAPWLQRWASRFDTPCYESRLDALLAELA